MLRAALPAREKRSLLSRYSATMGELALRRHTELAMMAAKAESDLANRAKSALLGTMSHELRTPLNAIIGFSDLIRTLKPSEDAAVKSADYAGYIGEAGRHLLEVVSDILDMSKIESGAFTLERQTCSVARLIEETLPLVAGRIADKHQALEVRIQSRIPKVLVDGRRIKQILINLISNATKFTPEQGRIMLVARGNKDGGATICVVDSGVGMSLEDIAVALSPFGQVQSHLSRSHEGTGLGLPIALGLARQHGGDLYIESEPGEGTTVVLTLPAPNGPPVSRAGGGERRRPRRAAHSSRKTAP
ncbi:sensor histidine kinase [Caulobacter sp. KR2-114]|uniref:sensor histidine kinase n=1 Tax=Caulobacter sp. KR2-114 TaxID=3400912 RepID=UPI003BFFD6F8